MSQIKNSNPELWDRIQTHNVGNTVTKGEIYDDIKELERYLRVHKLYPADENRTVLDEYRSTDVI